MSIRLLKPSVLAWLVGGAVALAGAAAGVLYLAGWFAGQPKEGRSVDPGQAAEREGVEVPRVYFKDVTRPWGVSFSHHNGAFGKKLLPETMGSGVAVIDFDRDGKPDLLFVNSCPWPGQPMSGQRPTLKLYRNRGKGQFEDVTEADGLDVTMYGMGVTVGDFDNDGCPDLFVTGVGGSRLFRNVAGT